MSQDGQQQVMTTGQVAELAGVSRETLRRIVDQGRGPVALRPGRHLRFRRADVEAWLERRCLRPHDEGVTS
jgi:excisionase family DNA binding protein